MKFIDVIKGAMEETDRLSADLDRAHASHLRVAFDVDDEAATEAKIESLTAAITTRFAECQGIVIKLSKVKVADELESKLKESAIRQVAADLAARSTTFRSSQKAYLGRLRAMSQRSLGTTGGSLGMEWGAGEADDTPFVDAGFTEAQLEAVTSNRAFIDEREREVVELVKSIEDLAALFKDLSYLVVEQGSLLDRIDFNIEETSTHVEAAVVELQRAADHQRKARSKMCILLLCILVLVMIAVVIIKGV
jgi:syntaxin 16